MPPSITIDKLSIKNFKTFSSLDISNLARINLITGKNNSGKTSFLEALYLCLGPANPELFINILARRGIIGNIFSPALASYAFYNLDTQNKISFLVGEKKGQDFELQITSQKLLPYSITKPSVDEVSGLATQKFIDPGTSLTIKLTYHPRKGEQKGKKGNPLTTYAIFSGENAVFTGDRQTVFTQSVYISTPGLKSSTSDSDRYSYLDKKNRIGEFEAVLRSIEPNLKRTSLLIENNTTFVAGDVGYGLVPLSVLGEGMNRLATLLLAIASSENGVCLVDEIENGFHFSVLEKLWEGIQNFSKSFNCQVFASTHSYECLTAASKIFSNCDESQFKLHRLLRKESKVEFFSFDSNQLKAAIESEWEVR